MCSFFSVCSFVRNFSFVFFFLFGLFLLFSCNPSSSTNNNGEENSSSSSSTKKVEEKQMITITFHITDGENKKENKISLEKGTKLTVEQIKKLNDEFIQTKADHILDGWYSTEDFSGETITITDYTVNQNITVYAIWRANPTVTFNTEGLTPPEMVKVNWNSKLTKPTNPTKANQTFMGWFTDASFKTEFTFDDAGKSTQNVFQNLTLYGKFDTITVTFNVDGGKGGTAITPTTFLTSQIISAKGDKLSLADKPWKTNYQFVSWYKDDAKTQVFNSTTEKITKNLTLYAKYEETKLYFNISTKKIVRLRKKFRNQKINLVIPSHMYNLKVLGFQVYNEEIGGRVINNIPSFANNYAGNYTFNTFTNLNLSALDITRFGIVNISSDNNELLQVTLPNTLKIIEDSSFYRCEKLKNITIPPSVTKIERSAFFWCEQLTVKFLSHTPPLLGDSAFGRGAISLHVKAILVPSASGIVKKYQIADSWGTFFNLISADPDN